jgi:glycosyltransferase involved in cell wall biosynthesis
LDFVYFSILDWSYHSHGHAEFQIAKALAKDHRVLFVNTIGMRFPPLQRRHAPVSRALRKLRSISGGLRFPDPDLPNLAVFTPIQAPVYSGLIGAANHFVLKRSIARAMARCGIRDFAAVVTLPTFVQTAMALGPRTLIYNRSDRHSALEGSDPQLLLELEALLMNRADAVLYTSPTLFEAERDQTREAVLIGHGVDLDMFALEGGTSRDLDGLPRPRAAFFGELRRRALDIQLLERVVRLRPDVCFVLGGAMLDDLGALLQLPNVRLLPPCDYAAVPARWRSIDVAIMPYAINDWTLAIAPVKLNEILAMGIPAVGTPLPAFATYPDLIKVASDAESFARALDLALEAGGVEDTATRASRSRKVPLSGWEAIGNQIVELAARRRGPAGAVGSDKASSAALDLPSIAAGTG